MVTFRISDMTCGHCAGSISRAIAGVDPDARVAVDIPRQRVTVTSAATDEALMQAIRQAGYTPQKQVAAPSTRPPSGSGCGCGCRPRKAARVDLPQSTASSKGPCCG